MAEDKKDKTTEASAAAPESPPAKPLSLQDKVNSILSVAEDDDGDAELLEELSKPKKKFFGLFG